MGRLRPGLGQRRGGNETAIAVNQALHLRPIRAAKGDRDILAMQQLSQRLGRAVRPAAQKRAGGGNPHSRLAHCAYRFASMWNRPRSANASPPTGRPGRAVGFQA